MRLGRRGCSARAGSYGVPMSAWGSLPTAGELQLPTVGVQRGQRPPPQHSRTLADRLRRKLIPLPGRRHPRLRATRPRRLPVRNLTVSRVDQLGQRPHRQPSRRSDSSTSSVSVSRARTTQRSGLLPAARRSLRDPILTRDRHRPRPASQPERLTHVHIREPGDRGRSSCGESSAVVGPESAAGDLAQQFACSLVVGRVQPQQRPTQGLSFGVLLQAPGADGQAVQTS